METSNFKLGRRPFEEDSRDLKFAKYISDAGRLLEAADAPAAPDWTAMPTPSGEVPEVDDDDLGNDTIGLCVYAAPGHQVRLIGQVTGNQLLRPTRGDVVDAYARFTGYNPATGSGDNGAYVRDMLKQWQDVGMYGTRANAYVQVDVKNADEVAIATWAGCGLTGGYSLPIASQGQDTWDVPTGGWPSGQGPGTWGGHCIFGQASSPGLDVGNSWGIRTPWTPAWRKACCDELWMVLVDAWQMTSRAPNGIAWADLLSDVSARRAAR
jgi:hypothetical protein